MDDPWAAPWPKAEAGGSSSSSSKPPAPPRMSLSPPPDDDVDPWGPPISAPVPKRDDLPSLDALAPRKGMNMNMSMPSFDSALPSWGGEWGATPKKAADHKGSPGASPPQRAATLGSPTFAARDVGSPTARRTSLGSPSRGSPFGSPRHASATLGSPSLGQRMLSPKSPLQIPLPRSPSPEIVEQAVEAAWGGDTGAIARLSRELSRPSLTLSRPGTTSPHLSRTATPLHHDENDEEEEQPPSPGEALERALDVISPRRTPSPLPEVEDEVRGFPSPETAMRAALGELGDDEKLPDLDTLMVKDPPRDAGLGLAGLEASDIVRRSVSPSSDFGGFGSPQAVVASDPWGAEPWGAAAEARERDRQREATPSPSQQERQWERAQSEMRLRDELAPFERIQALKKEWDGVAAAVLGDNEPTVSEDEERKLDAAAGALREYSVDTLRSLTVIPDTTVPLQTETGQQLARALARPNPAPQSSLLYAPNVRRRPLGPGLESLWAQRSRLGEPELPPETRPSLDSSQGSRWSFWRKQAPPKPLVTSGGGMLERKSEEPGRSSGSRPPSISGASGVVAPSRPETPSRAATPATPTIPEDAVANSLTPAAVSQQPPQQQSSRMSRLFGWGKKKAPEEPSSAGAKEDLELTTDDFAFLAEVPSHTPPGTGDLLGDGAADLEQVLNAPKAVPLPAPLAPPPGAPKRNDSGTFVARMASAPAPAPSATDLLSGLDFDAPPPPSKSTTTATTSLWDDFLEPSKSSVSAIQPPKSTSPALPPLPTLNVPRTSSPLSGPPSATGAGFPTLTPTLTPTPPAISPVTSSFPSLVPSRPSTPKADAKPPSQSGNEQSGDFGFGGLSLSPSKSSQPTHAPSSSQDSTRSVRAYGPSGGLPPRARYGPSGPARGSVGALPKVPAPAPPAPVDSPPAPRKLTKGPSGYGKLSAVGTPSPPKKAQPAFAAMEPLRPSPSPSPSPQPPSKHPQPSLPSQLHSMSSMAPMAPMAPAKPSQPSQPKPADDFGDFGDFGDFTAPSQPTTASSFGTFASPTTSSSFGTFATPTSAADDDFGDFGDFTSFAPASAAPAASASAAPATPRIQSAAPTPPSKSSLPSAYRPSYTQPSPSKRSSTLSTSSFSIPSAPMVPKHLPPAQMTQKQASNAAIPTLAPPPGSSARPKPQQQANLLGGDDFGDFEDFSAPPPSASSGGAGFPSIPGPGPGTSNAGGFHSGAFGSFDAGKGGSGSQLGSPGLPSASALASLSASAGANAGLSPTKVDHHAAAELVHAAARTGPAQWPSTSPVKLAPPPKGGGDSGGKKEPSIFDLMDE